MTLKTFKILVVDDEQDYCDVMMVILQGEGYTVSACKCGKAALEALSAEDADFDLVLSDLLMPEMDGITLLKEIKDKHPTVEVIMMTAYGTIEKAVEAMKLGAYTYVTKGEDPEKLFNEIAKVKELRKLLNENKSLREKVNRIAYLVESKNETFQNMISIAEKASLSASNILILGESGVGKEVIARYIHNISDRRTNNFVDLNCHAIAETILESELFGHEKGSFTGAMSKRVGRFVDADKGTLFLDEIGDIPLSIQAKLLKVLENKRVYPIGTNNYIDVDFRLITATNKNLQDSIEKELFREDLYYRLSTITIEIPPLRERKEDLPAFIEFFLEKGQSEMKKNIRHIEPEVMSYLQNYDYPGNVRELKNIIERLLVLSDDGIIKKNHLQPRDYKHISKTPEDTIRWEEDGEKITKTLREVRKEEESRYIKKIIKQENGNLNKVAEVLGITRRQLSNKLTEFQINEHS